MLKDKQDEGSMSASNIENTQVKPRKKFIEDYNF